MERGRRRSRKAIQDLRGVSSRRNLTRVPRRWKSLGTRTVVLFGIYVNTKNKNMLIRITQVFYVLEVATCLSPIVCEEGDKGER